MEPETLLIPASDVRKLLTLPDCIEAVERIFRLHAQGRIPEPGVLGVHTSVLPGVSRVHACDRDPQTRAEFSREMSRRLGIAVEPVEDVRAATLASDVCVTCTPSHVPLVRADDIKPGTFLAAVGADSPEKHELDADLLGAARVVVDVREQCAAIGEFHHALAEGALSLESVHADLGEVVAGTKAGRSSPSETFVFDSTGTALQDVAAASLVYERAMEGKHGSPIALGS